VHAVAVVIRVIEDHRAASGSYNARYMGDVRHEREGGADVEGRSDPFAVLRQRWR
jgi:hypothetical protein